MTDARASAQALFSSHHGGHTDAKGGKKDKLAEQKRQEKELKEALKADREAKKQHAKEGKNVETGLAKSERMHNGPTSKRAAKDLRAAEKKEHKKERMEECEHGVVKCRICYPHSAKDKHSHHGTPTSMEE